MSALKIGLVVNPIAGSGGTVGLKGSDGQALQTEAKLRGGSGRGNVRTAEFLHILYRGLNEIRDRDTTISWLAAPGLCGDEILTQNHIDHSVTNSPTVGSAADTIAAVGCMINADVDLVLFVGGDGTARDVLSETNRVSPTQLVLGIPAGVKMHSGVFAVTPRAAAAVVLGIIKGELTSTQPGSVVDFDSSPELSYASTGSTGAGDAAIRTRHYGELHTPRAGGFLQHTKEGGRESEPLALEEICADVLERLEPEQPLILGPGGTLAALKQRLGFQGTLRGFDVWLTSGNVRLDVGADALESIADKAKLIISFTRGQGFLLGRGNQQVTPNVLRLLKAPLNMEILGTRSKLQSLDGRPLLVDTSDAELDQHLCGLTNIVSGYEDRLLHRVSTV